MLLENTISEKFAAICQAFSGRIAIKTPSSRLTYLELNRASDSLALGLLDLGIRNGDRIAITLGNCVPYAVVSFDQPVAVVVRLLIMSSDFICVLQDWSNGSTIESSLHE